MVTVGRYAVVFLSTAVAVGAAVFAFSDDVGGWARLDDPGPGVVSKTRFRWSDRAAVAAAVGAVVAAPVALATYNLARLARRT